MDTNDIVKTSGRLAQPARALPPKQISAQLAQRPSRVEASAARLGAPRQLVKRVPFTLALLALIILAGLLNGAYRGAIDPAWFERVGYAPRDLWHLRLDRVLSSALFTERPRGFYQALWLIALGVGGVEWRFGTSSAFGCFWGLHTLAVVAEALILGAASALTSVATLTSVRDIGPSAGYFGCLAVLFGTLPGPRRWLNPVFLVSLSVTLIWSLVVPTEPAVLNANLAHVVTYALGWWVAARIR